MPTPYPNTSLIYALVLCALMTITRSSSAQPVAILFDQFCDINGDGLIDVMSAELTYSIQESEGEFGPEIDIIPTSNFLYSTTYTTSDLDNDGDMDIAAVFGGGDSNYGAVFNLYNDGNAQFSGHIPTLNADDPEGALTTDVLAVYSPILEPTTQGHRLHYISLDICDAGAGSQYVLVTHEMTYSDTDFVAPPSRTPLFDCGASYLGEHEIILQMGNMDDDPEEELYFFWGNLRFMYDFTDDSFTSIEVADFNGLKYVTAADIDQDGDQDVIYAISPFDGSPPATYMRLNDGTGAYSEEVMIAEGYASGLASADLDGDGDQDIVSVRAMSQFSGEMTFIMNNGSEVFEQHSSVTFETERWISLVALAMTDEVGTSPQYAIAYGNIWNPVPLGTSHVPLDFGCPADISGEGVVDVVDFIQLNSAYGQDCFDCPQDLSGDGTVDVADFLILNSAYGESCE